MTIDTRPATPAAPASPERWRAGARYEPVTASVRSARRFIESELRAHGSAALADDAGLVLTELAGNAVLHARTPFEVVVSGGSSGHDTVRVEVSDASRTLPLLAAPLGTSMSGRGMVLVAALASRWGSERTTRGKVVWFEVGTAPAAVDEGPEPSAEQLLAMWADLDRAPTVVIHDLPVPELLAAKEHLDDLVRELQIVMHDPSVAGRDGSEVSEALRLARRLDDAVAAFEPARMQVRAQVARAARARAPRVTLELVLDADAGHHACRFLEAVMDAEQLSRRGLLLTRGEELGRHSAIRRLYLEELVRQLGGHRGGCQPS